MEPATVCIPGGGASDQTSGPGQFGGYDALECLSVKG